MNLTNFIMSVTDLGRSRAVQERKELLVKLSLHKSGVSCKDELTRLIKRLTIRI